MLSSLKITHRQSVGWEETQRTLMGSHSSPSWVGGWVRGVILAADDVARDLPGAEGKPGLPCKSSMTANMEILPSSLLQLGIPCPPPWSAQQHWAWFQVLQRMAHHGPQGHGSPQVPVWQRPPYRPCASLPVILTD